MSQSGVLANLVVVAVLAWYGPPATAADDPSPASIRLGPSTTERWEIGVVIKSPGVCTGITATIPVPTDWPEQQVKIVGQRVSAAVRSVDYRTLDDGVKQMVVKIPRLNSGDSAEAIVVFEITKSAIQEPADAGGLAVPSRIPADVRQYMGTSPYIETRHPKIQALAREVGAGEDDAWKRVEKIFDWVRGNIDYRFDVKIKGALAALDDGYGDCEELTSLFVALCRANGIPARAVWIPAHCYPEFYLVDAEGHGHWYPCQAAGARDFGSMPEFKPILQKGDNFRVPGNRQPQRYVSETLEARNASADPQVTFIRQPVPDEGAAAPR